METFICILLGIIAAISLLLIGRSIVGNFLEWSTTKRQASELLRAVLTREQYCQLIKQGYLDIPSPRYPQRVYRVPLSPGRVGVIEEEKLRTSLCLQPYEWLPDGDIVVIHKLMIEADEETYLRKANSLVPLYDGN